MEAISFDAILKALNLGANLLYKALWPILFGVLLTAIIDTFINKEKVARLLGGRDISATAKASFFGALSSACTYGAVSIAHSLFKKGASAESTFAFSFGSTNLVFELGILIYILLGPAFLGAELLGGLVLITIMYLLVHFTLPEKTFNKVREQKQKAQPENQASLSNQQKRGDWIQQLKGIEGWYRISENFFSTIMHIYKSVIGGFLIAGFIMVFVPSSFWNALFWNPVGFWSIAENAAMGVVAGVASFIASIGNVPFAAALWFGGVSFSGVIACIYSDLITIPVLSLWRKFYGWKIMWYVFVVFFFTMALSGLLMEYLFRAFNWIPVRPASVQIISYNFELNFSTIMTFIMLAVTSGFYYIKQFGKKRKSEENLQKSL